MKLRHVLLMAIPTVMAIAVFALWLHPAPSKWLVFLMGGSSGFIVASAFLSYRMRELLEEMKRQSRKMTDHIDELARITEAVRSGDEVVLRLNDDGLLKLMAKRRIRESLH